MIRSSLESNSSSQVYCFVENRNIAVKVGLFALGGAFLIIGSFALSGYLLPQSTIGFFLIKFTSITGIKALSIGFSTAGFAFIAIDIFLIYLKSRTLDKNKNDKSLNHSEQVDSTLFDYIEQTQESDSISQFPPDYLLVLKAVLLGLQKGSFEKHPSKEIETPSFKAWFDHANKTINILDKKSSAILKMIINKSGHVTSLSINGIYQNKPFTISHPFEAALKFCFMQSFEISSNYHVFSTHLIIRLVKNGLEETPKFHLKNLTSGLGKTTQQNPIIFVGFLDNNLNGNNFAFDAGGPSRDYLDDLFKGITKQPKHFQKVCKSSFVMPRTESAFQKDQPLPALNDLEKEMFFQIGLVVMYSFLSLNRPIGRHFHDALFSAALCLNEEEIETAFDELSKETKLKLCRRLVEAYDKDGHTESVIQSIKLLLKKETLTDEEIFEAASIVHQADLLPEDMIDKDNYTIPDEAKVLENREVVLRLLENFLFGFSTSIGTLGTQLAPIHAIAQGMKSFTTREVRSGPLSWGTDLFNSNYQVFSAVVQGSLDRSQIIESIEIKTYLHLNQSEIEKKVTWLKEWLSDEATDDEVRKFLKVVTGTSSLPQNIKIRIKTQRGCEPATVIHACSFIMEFSPNPSGNEGSYNDFTKEDFIKCFKEVHLKDTKPSYTID